MKKFCLFLLLGCSLMGSLMAQGPYTWQDHLSLGTCYTLARFNGKIYASNYNGLVMVDEAEGSTQRLNKINGLSDVGITLLRVNPVTNKLMVVYSNANIDIIGADGSIINFPDIKLKTINGKKVINEIFFKDKYAYLASGLGIIVFDTEKLEIKDTYIIGPGGNNLEVFQVAMNDSLIFAATPNGLLRANYKIKILNNFNNWQPDGQLPQGLYAGVAVLAGNKMVAAKSPSYNDANNTDSLYMFVNNQWSLFRNSDRYYKIGYAYGDKFTVFSRFGPQVLDAATNQLVANLNWPGIPSDVIFYPVNSTDFTYWMADRATGLYQAFGSAQFETQHFKNINGTHRSNVARIDAYKGIVAVAPTFITEEGGNHFDPEGLNRYENGEWKYVPQPPGYFVPDWGAVLIDRKNTGITWVSSWSYGLCKIENGSLTALYNATNSAFAPTAPDPGLSDTRTSGLSMDEDGNLWVAISDNKEYMAVRKKDGSFQSFNFGTPRFTRKILVDKNKMVWTTHERDQGVTVFYPGSNYNAPVEGVNFRVLSKDPNFGNLESNTVYSIAEDKDGKIWVGTSAGIRVFYNPANMFSGQNFDAQPIKIVQDGNVELLLEKESVMSIVVDGANNKWVGTQAGGLYCFSPDGQKQLYHFTKDNSPLYADFIYDLAYNEATGDIFIGSELGLQTFRSATIEGDENYNNIAAFPNPVKPGYNGHVFVKGLVDNSVVKITDEAGNLVWETKSAGGQIEWPVKNLSGTRAASGVYIVYAATTTGEMKALTKVLVVN